MILLSCVDNVKFISYVDNKAIENMRLFFNNCKMQNKILLVIDHKHEDSELPHIFWYRIYPVDRIIINDKFSGFIMLWKESSNNGG